MRFETDSSMGRYLDEIGEHQLLSADDEVRLARAVALGAVAKRRLESATSPDDEERPDLARQVSEGEAARRQLIESNLRLVVYVARQYQGHGADLLDLVQAGNVGLMSAVDRFDWRLGHRFSTYAMWWIRQAIRRTLSETRRPIRLPANVNRNVLEIGRTRDRLRVELGHEPTLAETAAALGMAEERVTELVALGDDVLSLSMPVREGATELGDLLAADDDRDPALAATTSAEHAEVRQLLEHLGEREATVLRRHFGLQGCVPRSLAQIGRELGLTGERVRQIEALALERLRREQSRRAERVAS